MSKLSIRVILSLYISTLYIRKNGEKRRSIGDILVQIVLPILVGILAALFDFRLQGISNLIAGVAIVSALLGAVAVFLFQTRLQLHDKMFPTKPDSAEARGTIFDYDDINVLDELFFSVMWCILEGMAVCVALIICDCIGLTTCTDPYWAWTLVSSLVAMISCNLVFVLMMCLKRMTRIYERFGMHKSKDKLSK